MEFRRTIVVGDIHGCLQELDELLRQVQFDGTKDQLIFAGDLVDRGPDPVGVVRRAQELGAKCVMGNHEEKHIRFSRWEQVRRDTGKKNPMRPFTEKRAAEHVLLQPYIEWLSQLPFMIRIDPLFVVVHAGVAPGKPIEEQEARICIRARYVDEDGEMVSLKENLIPPTGAEHWSEQWNGPEWIVYGHYVYDTGPYITERDVEGRKVKTFGIDTGCCFGLTLTAMIIYPDHRYEFSSVKSSLPLS